MSKRDYFVEEIELEESMTPQRDRAWRRKKDYSKANRKQRIAKTVGRENINKFFGQYIKGKIHCSCGLCAAKTKGKHVSGSAIWYMPTDQRKIDSMRLQEKEFGSGE